MTLHDFVMDGRIYRQNSGGSIGLDLTDVVADIFMCKWDRDLAEEIVKEKFDIIVYKRYKDDVNFVLDVFCGGVLWQ